MTALSTSGNSRPFDARRDGFVMTEGGRRPRAWRIGTTRSPGAPRSTPKWRAPASTADAHHITAPAPDGDGAVACMELALADAGIAAGEVVHINAHGTSTPLNDLAEARAITKVFGEPGPPSSPRPRASPGHGLAAAGAIEAVASVLDDPPRHDPADGRLRTAGPGDHDRGRARRASVVVAGPGAVELLRLRRPQRLPRPAASRLSPAAKVAAPPPPGGE